MLNKQLVALIISVAANVSSLPAFGAIGSACDGFSQQADSAYNHQDAVTLVRLAADTIGKDCWNMGGGQGPVDSSSLRISAISLGASWIFDSGGVIRSDVQNSIASPTDAEQEVINWLSVSPTDTQNLLALLTNTDCAARWIGVYKAGILQSPDQSVVDKLNDIVANDSYIVLENIPLASSTSTDAVNREFAAPLRVFASQQLAKWNQNAVVDQNDIANAGVENLLDDYSANPTHKDAILWAVSRLTMGHSPTAQQALNSFTADTQARQQALSDFRSATTYQ